MAVLSTLALGVLSSPHAAWAGGTSTQASCYGADYGKKGSGWWWWDENDINTTKSPKYFMEMLAASGFSPS
ncbi:MAG TPA: hypothetical protein VIK83_00430, partial [Coriobacteriia bacterium]